MFGEHDESDASASDAIAAAELDDLRDRWVYAARLRCVLQILHIAVTAGMTSTFFMGPLGKGPWNEWEKDHVFSLLGLVWHNTSRSDSCNANFERWKGKVAAKFPDKEWDVKFIKPAETLWMVVFDGAKDLKQRWEKITWLFCDWAPQNILKTAFKSYWSLFGSRVFFGGRRSGVHADARNDDQEASFDTPVLDGGVRYASSVFCAVCFEAQGSV